MTFQNKDFVHWHVHSEYSQFDGLAKLQKLVNRAREMGFPAMALTDHGNIMGWIKFLQACHATKNKKGEDLPTPPIKPILGIETYLSRKMDIGQYDERKKKKGEPKKNQPEGRKGNRHINLFAMNYKGYQNICKLSHKAFTEGFYADPRLDISTLAAHSEGVMASTACMSSLVNVNLRLGKYDKAKEICGILKDIFEDNFFLEAMYHGMIEQKQILPDIFRLSKEMEIPVICTNDVHYIHKKHAPSQEVLMCMSQGKCLKDPNRIKHNYNEFYLKSAEEMAVMFGDHPECFVNSIVMAERIDSKDIESNLFGGMRLPKFDIPAKYKDSYDYLTELAWEGMKRVGWDKSEKHIAALKKELVDVKVARDNNHYDFSTYFLIVRDYIQHAKENGVLVGSGRGSGYASVLLRCLGITYGIDPLEYGLLWERFLGFDEDDDGKRFFARAGFPDVDTDFDDEGRNDVYKYIIDRYGRDYVGNIGTHGFLKFKSCITRVVKALDIADSFYQGKDRYITDNVAKVTEILSPFPKGGLIRIKGDDGEDYIINSVSDAYAHCAEFRQSMDQYPDIKHHAEYIEGVFAAPGFHAAGIVISNVPIEILAPLRTTRESVLATQFPAEDLEKIGLIKFDILALSTLSVIKRTVKLIKENYDIEIDLENLPLDDAPTLQLYRDGNLGGVFQCEKWGMQRTMRDIGVDNFRDIIAGLALYRPGPMDSIPKYCARKNGEEKISYFHPSIEPFVKEYLEKTYGVLCYQEQVMQICNSLAGFSITDGYVMIKAIGKKKKYLMSMYEKQFIEGCKEKNIDEHVIQQYWTDYITPFASYGFNLAHSACYGYNSYTTAYLKANYPSEFVCSFLDVVLTGSGDKYDKIAAFEKEFTKKMNIKFLNRDINRCKVNYVVEKTGDKQNNKKTEIRPSLLCKGVGLNAACEIEKKQPFKNMQDFVERIDTRIVDIRVVGALATEGYWGSKAAKNPAKLAKDFTTIRDDIRKAAQRGVESGDIFG